MTGLKFDMAGESENEKVFCKACNESFATRRSLHAHVKVHGLTIGDYYVKYFPKADLYTGDQIPFKNFDQYVSSDFRHKKNMYAWLDSTAQENAVSYCQGKIRSHIAEKGVAGKFAPNYLYLLTHPRLPKMRYARRLTDWGLFCSDNALKSIFTNTNVENLSTLAAKVNKSIKIAIDTREQQPLSFDFKTESVKLDFGDYTLMGDDYSYFFVDRKSEDDFKGTMSGGFERFCRELDRTRSFGAYIFVVIESDMRKIYANNNLKFKQVNLDYTWENMRKIILNYSDVCQFVFTGSRAKSSEVIPVLLKFGAQLKNCDLQEKIDEESWLGS